MKIAFLTSCLAPGKDGVGDYTQLLAEECERLGHRCALLALNDKFAADESSPGLRLSADRPWSERLAQARSFLEWFKPDAVSLQFVCYGYHPKGIQPRLAKWFQPLINGARLHLMLHELWIGEETGASLKARLIGAAQRWSVLNMVRRLQPNVVSTTNPAYQSVLRHRGIAAGQLPLFSPIPVRPAGQSAWVFDELQRGGVSVTPETRDTYWLFGFFGTLHPVWPPEPLFAYLREAAWRHGKRLGVCAIGRIGSGEVRWKTMTRDYAGAFAFCPFGEQPPERVSDFLHAMDFGIATSPLVLLGKSGTATAMIEHGLPVIVNRNEVRFRAHAETPNGTSPLVVRMDPELPRKLAAIRRQPPQPTLPTVARKFLYELER